MTTATTQDLQNLRNELYSLLNQRAPFHPSLLAIAGLAVTDSNVIVGNGTTWVAESGATARTSLGLGAADDPTFDVLTVTSVTIGANTLNTAEWAYLDGQDQAVKTSSSPTFAAVTIGTVFFVESDGDTYWAGDGTGLPYGSFYGNEIGWSATLNAANKLIDDSEIAPGSLNLTTYTDGNDAGAGATITVTKAGQYLCNWYLDCESSVVGKHVIGGLMVDSTTVIQAAGQNHIEHTSVGRELAMSGSAILDLAAGQAVGVGVGHVAATALTITVNHVGLTVVSVGGT